MLFLLLIILWAQVLVYLVSDKRRHVANGGGTERISCPSVNVFGKCGAISPFLVDLHANHTFPPLKRNLSVKLLKKLNSELLRLSKKLLNFPTVYRNKQIKKIKGLFTRVFLYIGRSCFLGVTVSCCFLSGNKLGFVAQKNLVKGSDL